MKKMQSCQKVFFNASHGNFATFFSVSDGVLVNLIRGRQKKKSLMHMLPRLYLFANASFGTKSQGFSSFFSTYLVINSKAS